MKKGPSLLAAYVINDFINDRRMEGYMPSRYNFFCWRMEKKPNTVVR